MNKVDIVGIYENITGGQRLTSGRIKSDLHLSNYALLRHRDASFQ